MINWLKKKSELDTVNWLHQQQSGLCDLDWGTFLDIKQIIDLFRLLRGLQQICAIFMAVQIND